MPSEPSSATGTGTMSPERFARVRAIFEAALEQPARDRLVFVKGACVGDAVLLREVEAMLAADATGAPLLDRPASTPSSSAPEEGRFPAGTVLAGRYRILGRLGQGGMGEVYRAHDLILNQTVALKFLAPAHLSEAALARFRNEVRIARQVSHPNVCRVYDLGMVEGLHFLSMEYIDGEDLASLLRRIGRLPQDKAIEFTRKICAGLGAAHERGVLHRDLKPANIMIDGRGQPRITDFGLAGLAAEIPLSDLRSGTPAYMSPEQKAGKDVTTRSDIYSLGLVLHEMFTGKARKDTQSSPSDLVKDLDPAIERLILRCLEEDPKRRPSSALNVAMALPGADPIAAALAAGETPSPEMVAASQEKEGFSPRAAWMCFAVVPALIALLLWQSPNVITRRASLAYPPSVLAFRAQEILKQVGYPDAPVSAAHGFECCDTSFLRALEKVAPSDHDAILASNQPAVLRFWYRQQDRDIVPDLKLGGGVLDYRQPAIEPGMTRLLLDPAGRLVELDVRPAETPGDSLVPPVDPAVLFTLAGLDLARFAETTARDTPPMAFDRRLAWTGNYGTGRSEEVRVSAAYWQGRPVYYRVTGNWTEESNELDRPVWLGATAVVLFLTIVFGSAIVARRHARLGRGDRRGAGRVGAAAFSLMLAEWALQGPHVARLEELGLFVSGLSFAVFGGGLIWALYMAVEPYVRRHWPDALISWTRVLSGQVRNPLVATHVLVGLSLELGFFAGLAVVASVLRPESIPGIPISLASLQGGVVPLGMLLGSPARALAYVIAFVLIIVLLRLLVRKLWIADALGSLLIGALLNSGSVSVEGDALVRVYFVVNAWALLWLLRRFGLLAMLVAIQCEFIIVSQTPGAWDSWYIGWGLLPWALLMAVAVWALWVILSAQRTTSLESATP
ncbi:MAG TPA: serine/threonine-protein kinase [Vicinamibacterales bacterium]|nr:serine/threonine-protein kinase [Vicinamibacterales bacterium]